jgi:hypothetical protein
MVVLPEKQMYGVIANVQAKLESKKCQFVEPVSSANKCIYRVTAANCGFSDLFGGGEKQQGVATIIGL